ncbi:Clavaminate synthase-like protein [Amniculicola lignicola CBS 123094]|uniref:Clavaminate synthase-like protein n=1 Tax=Amniculicola lignicola CBS 123094 TaxID=1392246 RepID=A0A6A5W8A3_9PLEO|nr:Clavaminate synthase-like protein [Amniculicola lignicola CBS 123094]
MADVDANVPSLREISQLIRSTLITTDQEQVKDPMRECGRPALNLLHRNPEICQQLSYQKLHDVPYKDVKTCWRRLYTEAGLRKVLAILEENHRDKRNGNTGNWITEVVTILDMILILTGAPGREEVVELVFAALKGVINQTERMEEASERPLKRRKLDYNPRAQSGNKTPHPPSAFPSTIVHPPTLRFPIPRISNPRFEAFQSRISDPLTQIPVVITDAIPHWPALNERAWNKPAYLMDHTLNGRRLVPIEIGRSYTDQAWGQKILSFGDFMARYMLDETEDEAEDKNDEHIGASDAISSTGTMNMNDTPEVPHLHQTKERKAKEQKGYLAQHDLFAQIPSLRSDICIPDYCYADPPSPLSLPPNFKTVSKLDEPLLNAWFGPSGTISPLHTDPYYNVLTQVVGYKYIRLYAPSQTAALHPRGLDKNGVDMSNTSSIDLDSVWAVAPGISPWPAQVKYTSGEVKVKDLEEMFPGFLRAKHRAHDASLTEFYSRTPSQTSTMKIHNFIICVGLQKHCIKFATKATQMQNIPHNHLPHSTISCRLAPSLLRAAATAAQGGGTSPSPWLLPVAPQPPSLPPQPTSSRVPPIQGAESPELLPLPPDGKAA